MRLKLLVHLFFLFLLPAEILLPQSGWQVINSQFGYTSISFPSKDTGYSVGTFFIAKTVDGGFNWTSLNATSHDYHGVFFLNNLTGWIVGSDITAKTTDGGTTFIYNSPGSNLSFEDVFFINGTTGWAAGSSKIYKTVDGGNYWSSLTLSPPYQNAVFFVNVNTGWCAGGGEFQKTINGGQYWIQQSVPNETYHAVYFINANTGWGVGGNSNEVIIKTTNAGSNWDIQSSGNSGVLWRCTFTNAFTGYACGQNGKIIRTTNGGTNWIFSQGGTTLELYSICFVNDTVGYTSGRFGFDGILLKTTNGGLTYINTVSNDIPRNFLLSQNYPNPFNPNTKFDVQIAKPEFVKVVVYNILGEKIAEPVSQNLQPGTYKVSFDASAYPSGTYFYRIVAGDFVDVKKMILIK